MAIGLTRKLDEDCKGQTLWLIGPIRKLQRK
jgi:hypothetical protein